MIRAAGLAPVLISMLAVPVGAQPPPDTEPPLITHVRITGAVRGAALTVRAKIDDDSEVFAPSVYVRPKGATEFDSIALRPVGDSFEAIIAAEQVLGDLEYFIEAFDEHGNGPSREGTPSEPVLVRVHGSEDAPPPPVTSATTEPAAERDLGIAGAWWFWTIVGVAVAGGAVGVYFALRPPGEVEVVDVTVAGPDPTGRLP